jgi:hypothetical protein
MIGVGFPSNEMDREKKKKKRQRESKTWILNKNFDRFTDVFREILQCRCF